MAHDRAGGDSIVRYKATKPRRGVALLPLVLWPALLLVVLVTGWALYASARGGFVPSPASVAKGFATVIQSPDAWSGLWVSNVSLIIGYLISVAIGIPLGLIAGSARWANRIISPCMDIAMLIPMVVVMPIVLVAAGLGRTSEVWVIILFAVPYIVVPIRTGVQTMPTEFSDVASAFSATWVQRWLYFLIPASRRSIATGLKLGLAHALTGLMVVELTLVALGIGRMVLTYQVHFMFGEMFAYVLLVALEVFVVIGLLSVIERKATD